MSPQWSKDSPPGSWDDDANDDDGSNDDDDDDSNDDDNDDGEQALLVEAEDWVRRSFSSIGSILQIPIAAHNEARRQQAQAQAGTPNDGREGAVSSQVDGGSNSGGGGTAYSSFAAVIASRAGLRSFHDYCVSEYASENIDFFQVCLLCI